MTVPSEQSRIQYTTDGTSVSFPVPFRFLNAAHLQVARQHNDESSILELGVDYSVSGVGNQAGGTITTTTTLPAGDSISIERVVPITQETAYQRNDPFPERAHEQALDKLTMICQMLGGVLGLTPGSVNRALLLGAADTDGKGSYRANGNQISNLGAPKSTTDAARLQDVIERLSGLAADGSGQFVVERLADTADPLNGPGMIGFDEGTEYKEGSVGAELNSLSSALRAINSVYRDKNKSLLSSAHTKLVFGAGVRIVCQGDSMTAGHDTTSIDKIAAPFPNPSTVAPIQYPMAAAKHLTTITGKTCVAINRGYSGDTAKSSYTRWATKPDADVAHVMLGINDADGAMGATLEEYLEYTELIIKRYIDWGIGVVFHTSTPQGFNSGYSNAPLFSQAAVAVAIEYGCPIFDSSTTVRYSDYDGVYSDSTHFNTFGYSKYGQAVAAFVLSGGWICRDQKISGEKTLPAGKMNTGIGYWQAGGAISGFNIPAANFSDGSFAEIKAAGSRVTYTFFLDEEFCDVYAVGNFAHLDLDVAFLPAPQYTGDDRGAKSLNRTLIKSKRGITPTETSKTIFNADRQGSYTGKKTLVARLVGRGWKTISFTAKDNISFAMYFSGILLSAKKYEESITSPSFLGAGMISGGNDEVLIYQIPYIKGDSKPTPTPAPASIPTQLVLPCPDGILPAKAHLSNFYDSLPVELTITSLTAVLKILAQRTGESTITLTKVFANAAGDSLMPTSAKFVYKAYDSTENNVAGGYIDGIGFDFANQFISFSFPSNPAGYYKVVMRTPRKADSAASFV